MPSNPILRLISITFVIALGICSCFAGSKSPAAIDTVFSAQEAGAFLERFAKSSELIQPLGIVVANIHDFEGKQAKKAKSEHDFGDRLQVVAVVKGSLAEQLGLAPGDVIMELNGSYVPKGKNAKSALKSRVIPSLNFSGELSATIIRDGFARSLSFNHTAVSVSGNSFSEDEG